MDTTLILYLLSLLALLGLLTFLIVKFKNNPWIYSILAAFYSLSFLWVAFNFGRDIFDAMSLACLGVFVGGTYLLILSMCTAYKQFRKMSFFFGFLAALLILVGLDAFLLEPNWLEVTRMSLKSQKVPKKVKIVIVSDIQTDHVGAFEEKVLKEVMKENADMIVFPGDYIQAWPKNQAQEVAKLNNLFKRVGLTAPMGIYATQGDTESFQWRPSEWPAVFNGLPVTSFTESSTVSNQYFAVTGLTLKDSYKLAYKAPSTELFHIWIGHRPGFSLDNPNGDLLIAGHTHGGQVRIPFFGPIFTFSRVPRIWGGGGLINLDEDKTLIISRGIGMERGHAPRLRFFCRPQLIVLELNPLSSDATFNVK